MQNFIKKQYLFNCLKDVLWTSTSWVPVLGTHSLSMKNFKQSEYWQSFHYLKEDQWLNRTFFFFEALPVSVLQRRQNFTSASWHSQILLREAAMMITTAFIMAATLSCGNGHVCPFTHLLEASLRTGSKLESVHNWADLKGYFADIAENWEISWKQTVVR